MSTLRKRLENVEAQRAFSDFLEMQRQLEGRTEDDMRFFVIDGYFPEAAGQEVPEPQDFTVGGIRTIIARVCQLWW